MILKGKTIIVTGAASGLGHSIALKCAAEGASVVCADIDDTAETVALVKEGGHEAMGVKVNITQTAAIEAACSAAESAYGGIDGLVNNAAISKGLMMKKFHEIDEAEWDRVMNVNAKGTWLCCKTVYPWLIKRGGGSIVNISSSSILEGSPFLTHYIASKAAVWGMTRSISRAAGEYNIRCNSVTLGFTLTESVKQDVAADPAGFQYAVEYAIKTRAIHRSSEPEDIVGGVAFLLSDDSAFITGQNLNIDGGCINY